MDAHPQAETREDFLMEIKTKKETEQAAKELPVPLPEPNLPPANDAPPGQASVPTPPQDQVKAGTVDQPPPGQQSGKVSLQDTEEPKYTNFFIGYFEAVKGINEFLYVYWSEISPEDFVLILNYGEATWDMEGKFLYRDTDGRIIAKTSTRYYGDILDELREEKAFFLPKQDEASE